MSEDDRRTAERLGRRSNDCNLRGICGVDRLAGRVDGQEKRLDDLAQRMDGLRGSFDSHTASVNRDLTQFRDAVNSDLKELSTNISEVDTKVEKLATATTDQTALLTTMSTGLQILVAWMHRQEGIQEASAQTLQRWQSASNTFTYPICFFLSITCVAVSHFIPGLSKDAVNVLTIGSVVPLLAALLFFFVRTLKGPRS